MALTPHSRTPNPHPWGPHLTPTGRPSHPTPIGPITHLRGPHPHPWGSHPTPHPQFPLHTHGAPTSHLQGAHPTPTEPPSKTTGPPPHTHGSLHTPAGPPTHGAPTPPHTHGSHRTPMGPLSTPTGARQVFSPAGGDRGGGVRSHHILLVAQHVSSFPSSVVLGWTVSSKEMCCSPDPGLPGRDRIWKQGLCRCDY